MKYCITTFLFFLVIVSRCLAQTASNEQSIDNLKNVIPPSPNSSSLGKYGDWPVSLYTGVPNISVPIYTINENGINIPISLSYHAAGNKVGEIASWVGLGWSLNAGGLITRALRGLPDEDGYLLIRQQYTDPGNLASNTIVTSNASLNIFAAANGEGDSEQDVFSLNAMGKSYRLLFKGDGSIATIPISNIKITVNASLQTFIVLLEDGTKMTFGGSTDFLEETNNARSNIGYFYSSWMLQNITYTNGETVNFTYTSNYVKQDSYFSESDNIEYRLSSGLGCDNLFLVNQSLATRKNVEKQTVKSLNINSIETDLTRVEFVQDTAARQDVEGGYALKDIKVFSKLQNSYIEQYRLNYVYSAAVASTNELLSDNLTPTQYGYYRKRLKLNSVVKNSPASTEVQTWQMDYNPQNLPSRRSYAQDHWGFYNGALSNTTLLPGIHFVLPSFTQLDSKRLLTGFMPPYHDIGGNREGNAAYTDAEILKKITYPTGGCSMFTYEPNSIPVNEEQFQNQQLNQSIYLSAGQNPFVNFVSTTFRISKPGYLFYSINTVISSILLNDQPGAKATLEIINQTGTTVFNTSATSATGWINLKDTGTYTYKITTNTLVDAYPTTAYNLFSDTYIKYTKSLGVQSINRLTGGLRIKNIVDSSNNNLTEKKQRNFVYEYPFVINPVDVVGDYVTVQNDAKSTTVPATPPFIPYDVFCNFIISTRNSSTRFSYGSIQGGTVGYGKVTTLYGPNAENGKTVSLFSQEPDANAYAVNTFPYGPSDSRDYKRGLLLNEKQYTAGNNLQQETSSTYDFVNRQKVTVFKSGYKELGDFNGNVCGVPLLHFCSIFTLYYDINTEQVRQLTSSKRTYSGSTVLFDSSTNFYDNPANLSPTRSVTVTSDGDTLINIARTPLEKTDINVLTPLTITAAKALDSMVARNIIGMPVQQVNYRNYAGMPNNLTNLSLINYKLWGNNMVLPENVQIKVASNPIETRVQFNKYSVNGNLLEQQKVLDVKKNYLYDYKNTYPIAEVTNADSASIAYTSFESDGLGNWVNTDTARNRVFAITGSQCYSLVTGKSFTKSVASGTAYIVSYWSRNGAVTVTANGTSTSATPGLVKNLWTYYEHSIPTTTTSIIVTATSALIDELRLYPSTAQMTTYTFIPLVGMSSVCSPNNMVAYYEYDAYNRLMVIRDMDKNIVKQMDYQYQTWSHANPVWQTITGPYCEVVSGNNTGNQITVQKDVNPQSTTYGNTQTLTVTNTTACPLPVNVTITCDNFAAVPGYTAKYTNITTGTIYTFAIGSGASTQTLGTVPQGTYTLTFTKTGGTVTYVFSSGCSTKSGTTPVTFNNVSVSTAGCKNISIDTVQ